MTTKTLDLESSLSTCEMMGYDTADYLRLWFGNVDRDRGSILFVRRSLKQDDTGHTYRAVKGFRPDQIAEAAAFVASFKDGDSLFIKTSTFDQEKIVARMNRGETVVGNKHEVDTVCGIAMDVDAGKRDSYASQADVWEAIHQMPVLPTMIVLSGELTHGFHCYWKLIRPIPMQSADDVELLNQRAGAWRDLLCEKIAAILTTKGLVGFDEDKLVDRTYGVDRVLRPVGATRASGAVVQFAAYHPDRQYTLGDLTAPGWQPPGPAGAAGPSWPRAEESIIERYFQSMICAGKEITIEGLLPANGYKPIENGKGDWVRDGSETGSRSLSEGDIINGLPGVNVFSGGCSPLKCCDDHNDVGRRYSLYALWVAFNFGDVDLEVSWKAAGGFCREFCRASAAEVFSAVGENDDFAWLTQQQHRTENTLATHFIDTFGDNLRYVPEWKKWLVWDGRRFAIDNDQVKVLCHARKFARSLWVKLGAIAALGVEFKDELAAIVSFCKASNKKNSIAAFLSLARADLRVIVLVGDLDQHPHLLNLSNGTYDFDSRDFREHRQEDLMTQLANVSFRAGATCPMWDRTLRQIFPAGDDVACGPGDQELITYVQRIFGYSLAGGTGEHLLPIAYGGGNNGKSTVWNTIINIVGEDYGCLASETLLMGAGNNHPTEKVHLYQKRIVAISEPEQGSELKESRVKELTGDLFITARRMREDLWQFKRTHTFWLSSNHLPKIKGTDEGIWRRIKPIPFTVDFRNVKGIEEIKDLHLKLAEHEGPGILNWLIAGAIEYAEFGLQDPKVVTAAHKLYRSTEDHMGIFIDECCEQGPEFSVKAGDFFQQYRIWGGKMENKEFAKTMKSRFDWKKKMDFTYYFGVQIKINFEHENATNYE